MGWSETLLNIWMIGMGGFSGIMIRLTVRRTNSFDAFEKIGKISFLEAATVYSSSRLCWYWGLFGSTEATIVCWPISKNMPPTHEWNSGQEKTTPTPSFVIQGLSYFRRENRPPVNFYFLDFALYWHTFLLQLQEGWLENCVFWRASARGWF